jgi:hypothetical protein
LRVRIGRILVRDGETDFTDLSLPLPFAARVRDMQGELSTIDSSSAAPSRIRIEGRVDEYGLARVDGQLRVSSPTDLADIGVLFRNIEMPPLSPYTVKFAGRRIARGKINLDLRYRFEERRLVGENRIVIDELELGEKVPQPDAMDLPLGLAVALLKDANGRIDIDMPVSGSLDDPQFGIGRVLWKAFVNLVTRIATSPFRLLGGLVGREAEDLGTIEFAPGRADLLPPEREKILRVAEALGQRPSLAVEIPPVVDPEADAAVLRTARMQEIVDREIGASGKAPTGRALEKRTREVVESLFGREVADEPLDTLRARFTAPPPDDPGGRPQLDEPAYLEELRTRIAQRQVISADDLALLGNQRATGIRDGLVTGGQVPAARVRITGARQASARDGSWVPVELRLVGAAE